MRRRFSRPIEGEEGEEPLINLTPLIDVVFVVLITFILIAPILQVDLVELAAGGPSSVKQSASTSSALSLSVRADNTIWYQGRVWSLKELEPMLREEKRKNPRAIPQLAQDERAQFGTYQSVKSLLERVGFEEMELLLRIE